MATTTDLYERLLSGIAAVIAALDLQGDGELVGNVGGNVLVQTEGTGQVVLTQFPAIVVTNEGQTEEENDWSSFETDGVSYPALILLYDQTDVINPTLAAKTYRAWRKAIQSKLRGLVAYPILPGIDELITINLRNRASLSEGIPAPDRIVWATTAVCETSEQRERNDG